MIEASFSSRGFNKISFCGEEDYLSKYRATNKPSLITYIPPKRLQLGDAPPEHENNASCLDCFEEDLQPKYSDERTKENTSDGEVGIRRCVTVQDFEESIGHDEGSQSFALCSESETPLQSPSSALDITSSSAANAAERRSRGDELLDALIHKQKDANFKRIETRKQLAREKAIQEAGSIQPPVPPTASQPPKHPVGTTLQLKAPSAKETPAKKPKLDVKEELTPAKVGNLVRSGQLKMEFERTRSQYLVRSGFKGHGQNKSFKFGPPPAKYVTKEDAEAAAQNHYRFLAALQLAAKV